jgi:hypothetical protein
MEESLIVGTEKPGMSRNRENERTSAAENPGNLPHCTGVIVNVLQDVRSDYQIEAG